MKRYRTDFSDEDLKKALLSKKDEAEEILNDLGKWEKLKKKFDKFIHKAYYIPVLGSIIDDVISMYQLVGSYIEKEYTDIPVTSVIAILAALLYVISPIDLIPDFIPVIGYLDDAAVVTFVLKLGGGHDLEKYKNWQEELRENAINNVARKVGLAILEVLNNRPLGALVLSKNESVRIVIIENIDEEPYQSTTCIINLPVDILREMFIEKEEDYIDFLNRVIKQTSFEWSPIGKLEVIHEAFICRYEDYFNVEEEEGYE